MPLNLISFSNGQYENADLPILVTLFGMTTPVSVVHEENALFPIIFTGFPLYSDGMNSFLSV